MQLSPTTSHLGWLALLLLASCVDSSPGTQQGGKTDHPELTAEGCPRYAAPISTGSLTDNDAVEISGAVMSRANSGVLWVHNDGNEVRLYAINRDGEKLAEIRIPGIEVDDLEDIAIGPGPIQDQDYLYLADIGDNGIDRSEVRILRIPEPSVDNAFQINPDSVESFRLRYPGGASHDAEALMVDPSTGAIFVITKDGSDEKGTALYRLSHPLRATEVNVLTPVVSDHDSEALRGSVVAADVSHDGQRVALLLKEGGVRTWTRHDGDQSIEDMFRRPACHAPSAPGQQEALALSVESEGFYLIPEGINPRISFVATRQPCGDFDRSEQGEIRADSIQEVSGLAVSWRDSNLLWSVNDSGEGLGRNYLSAVHVDGWHVGDLDLSSVDNEDWEDLAIGPGPVPGLSYLYIADIGDNGLSRKSVQIHRLVEPRIGEPAGTIDTLHLAYPGHRSHDAESLFVDPITGDIYIITRRRDDDTKTRVYRAQAPFDLTDEILLTKVLDEGDSQDLRNTIVAADISQDGLSLALARRSGRPLLFQRSIEAPAFEALKYPGCRSLGAPGKQDSIALSPDGSRYYLLAEGASPSLFAIDALPLDD